MKITKKQLRQIIEEEIMKEADSPLKWPMPSSSESSEESERADREHRDTMRDRVRALAAQEDVRTTYELKLNMLQVNFIIEAVVEYRDQILFDLIGEEPTDKEKAIIDEIEKIL